MQVDYIILGQGISGTFLSYYLMKEGATVYIIDEPKKNTASRVASGVINPITGRRIVKTWMIDALMTFAETAYEELAQFLSLEKVIENISIYDFIPTTQMLAAYEARIAENEVMISFAHDTELQKYFHFPFKIAEIKPAYKIALKKILHGYRNFLEKQKLLDTQHFDWEDCQVFDDKICYKNIVAKKVICCDGVQAASTTYFKNLPFAVNKGEALIVRIPSLPHGHIYKMGYTMVPDDVDSLFWIGSNYSWAFKDDLPTQDFKINVAQHLKNWLKLPFEIIDHVSGLRPANIERRPFAGFHPLKKSIGMLNGMGSKGCSLAPYFAHQLCQHMLYQKTLDPLVDIKRFHKILSK